jgi:hypothetical protein
MKYRIWSKNSQCYTHEPCYPGSSLHCASNYYLDSDGNIVDFVTTIGGNQDDASKCDVDQEAYTIELCTGFKATNGEYLYVNDLVEFPLGIKTSKGKIIYDHFCFWIVEKQGGVLKFDQKPYTYLGNYNKNPEILKAPTKIDNGSVGGH